MEKSQTRGLLEAYASIYEPREEPQELNENEIYDAIGGYLMAEGFAETEDAAVAIMANMSEQWMASIFEGLFDFLPKQKTIVPGIYGKDTVLAKKGGVEGVANKKTGEFTKQPGGWDKMDAARYSKEYIRQGKYRSDPSGIAGDPTTNHANRRVTPNRVK